MWSVLLLTFYSCLLVWLYRSGVGIYRVCPVTGIICFLSTFFHTQCVSTACRLTLFGDWHSVFSPPASNTITWTQPPICCSLWKDTQTLSGRQWLLWDRAEMLMFAVGEQRGEQFPNSYWHRLSIYWLFNYLIYLGLQQSDCITATTRTWVHFGFDKSKNIYIFDLIKF